MVAWAGRLRALGIELSTLRYLSLFCFEDHVSLEPLGFLCCIPNMTELVANVAPFLLVPSAGARRTSK